MGGGGGGGGGLGGGGSRRGAGEGGSRGGGGGRFPGFPWGGGVSGNTDRTTIRSGPLVGKVATSPLPTPTPTRKERKKESPFLPPSRAGEKLEAGISKPLIASFSSRGKARGRDLQVPGPANWLHLTMMVGAQKRAEMLHHPCILGGPQQREQNQNSKPTPGGHPDAPRNEAWIQRLSRFPQ